MAFVDDLITENLFMVFVVWIVVYVMDYYLTIIGSLIYRDAASRFIIYEGSYELTPVFKKDIDQLKWISPRFLLYLFASCIVILIFWTVDYYFLGGFGIFAFLMGALLLREAAVYTRHFRAIGFYLAVRSWLGLEGQVRYRSWLLYHNSGIEILAFALLFTVLVLLYRSWFLAGGALSCTVTGIQHLFWGHKIRRQTISPQSD